MSNLETQTPASSQSGQAEEITVGKTVVLTQSGEQATAFTMTLGGETITLLPLRNWSQLDVYKWRARGRVPGTPAGLDISFDHVKVAGETVSTTDPKGTAKLQKLLNEWLALERGSLELARQKAHPKQQSVEQEASARPTSLFPHFRVELDKEGQVHIKCLRGKETLATSGLTPLGFNSLVNQGLMHKPHSVLVGALHDWVELDGVLFSFETGHNDASKLEQALNDRYLSTAAFGQGEEVLVFTNTASATGFDIQFTARVGGVTDHRRRPLNEETLGLLQDTDRCDLLPKDLLIKMSPPNLIFKRKTPDGGERYLNPGPESVVTVIGDEGATTLIDLSRPVNYSRLTAMELTAVFNHPAINQHSRVSPPPSGTSKSPRPAQVAVPSEVKPPLPVVSVSQSPPPETKPAEAPKLKPESSPPKAPPKPSELKPVVLKPSGVEPATQTAQVIKPSPNLWLQAVLDHPAIRHDWFTRLVYCKMAAHFGNSHEDMFGPIPCWASRLGEVDDVCDPAFRGVFLTQKGGLAYLHQGHIVRFNNQVAFVGTLESTIEGIGVNLEAVGTDSERRMVFIVTEGYRTQFGIPEPAVVEELKRLREYGALILSASEVLQSPDPLELVWTVPAEQENPTDPQAVENLRPVNMGANLTPAVGMN